jgi:hypothetical protein
MTISKARATLKANGIHYCDYQDLYHIRHTTSHDGSVEQAIDRVMDYMLHGR